MAPASVFQRLLKGHCGKIIGVTVSADKQLRLFLMWHLFTGSPTKPSGPGRKCPLVAGMCL